jgi:hypothetical protein
MCDLELNFFLNLGGHPVKLRENEAIDNSASRRPSRTKLDVVPCALCSPDNLTQLPPGVTSEMPWVSNRMKGGLPACSLLTDIPPMEQEIDCKMKSNSR